MHKVGQSGSRLVIRLPARSIAGRRFRPVQHRQFSPPHSRSLSIFPLGSNNANEQPHTGVPLQPDESIAANEPSSSSSEGQNGGSSKNGSQERRWRNRRSRTGLAPVTIPNWFLENNVKLADEYHAWNTTPLEMVSDDGQNSGANHVIAQQEEQQPQPTTASQDQDGNSTPTETQRTANTETADQKSYQIHESFVNELQMALAGGLSTSRPDSVETFAGGKVHLKLLCPVDGAQYFLEKNVEQLGAVFGADIVRLDAQDLAEIAGDYIKEGPEATSNSLWSLGFDVQNALPKAPTLPPWMMPPAQEQEEGAEGEEDVMEDSEDRDGRHPKQHTFTGLTAIPIGPLQMGPNGIGDLAGIAERLQRAMQSSTDSGQSVQSSNNGSIPGLIPTQQQLGQSNGTMQWNDHKLNALLEILVDANAAKRSDMQKQREDTKPDDTADPSAPTVPDVVVEPHESDHNSVATEGFNIIPQNDSTSPRTILLIRGYKELGNTTQGRLILEKIVDIVQKKRKAGQPIMVVGVSASSALTTDVSHDAIKNLQSDGQQSLLRTLVMLPNNKGAIFRDEPKQTRATNIRNLHFLVHRLFQSAEVGGLQELKEFAEKLNKWSMSSSEASAALDSQLFSFDEVHRIALTALGTQIRNTSANNPTLDASLAVGTAMVILEKSDDLKAEWAEKEQQLQRPPSEASKAKSYTDARLKKLRKQCNHHERNLLKGVVHTESIRTTFDHVHAPAETIESLKNLTMLSLTRPEAFQYGVLATDKITGCLLYGPPGTGKTLLAKAVAKESGATVLEVSGSDVYDMYVGESEKNVRAIFSLAKKLSPCVVFIDEADAIFASRGSGTNRNSHRELINQFLREWDGMTDTNAFIMVATNRPFDLDDAALRRLPRRLLVDLPTEKDREAILGIHLKEESLDSSISLADLASHTTLYSGSDLKNMCVAAALAAVKEENDARDKHNEEKEAEDPEYVFPDRRTLHMRHFEKGMDEITASVSEDMSSLGAIRKFDEKYGDKRGKKKRGGYGFAGGGQGMKEETAKIRS